MLLDSRKNRAPISETDPRQHARVGRNVTALCNGVIFNGQNKTIIYLCRKCEFHRALVVMPRGIADLTVHYLVARLATVVWRQAMARFNYQRVSAEVHEYCNIESIDNVDPGAFEFIVMMHDTDYYTTIA